MLTFETSYSLHAIAQRLLAAARSVELDGDRITLGVAYQSRHGLSPQDSIIYASVISDLQTRPSAELKCFITRNSKDFDDPDIVAELGGYQCQLFFDFEDGLRYCAP
jgi:hypothetical protein